MGLEERRLRVKNTDSKERTRDFVGVADGTDDQGRGDGERGEGGSVCVRGRVIPSLDGGPLRPDPDPAIGRTTLCVVCVPDADGGTRSGVWYVAESADFLKSKAKEKP